MINKYRIYIDEVGDPGLNNSEDPRYRYLSLSGVIFNLEYVNLHVFNEIEELKHRYFASHHVDNPVIFHRKEMVNKKREFSVFRDAQICSKFNNDLINLIKCLDYKVITVTIDKYEHKLKYKVWRHDSYHYAMQVMLERYKYFLEVNQAIGDVMAESRAGKEDMRLKKSYLNIYENGTEYIKSSDIQNYLTSKELKIKSKKNNIAGLQLADIIAHPSYKYSLCLKNKQGYPENFGGQIAKILVESKYLRGPSNKLTGWGIKILP